MIYTVTLNPALDHFLDVPSLRVNETNRVTGECLYAGGKGIDVSRAVKHLGSDSIALGFIGGHNGRVMTELLKSEGVNCYFTPIAQETRRNVIVTTARRRTQTMLNAPGPIVSEEEWEGFLTHLALLELRDAYVVISGSLPRGIAPTAYRDIIELVQRRGARALLDADGACFKEGLKAKPFAIKPNLDELRRATGRALKTESDIVRTAARVHRNGIAVVLVSLGRKGLLAVDGESCYRVVPPAVTVRSTVGAGDSAVAGYIVMQAAGKSLDDSVRYAAAAGTAATLAPGNQLCRLADVQRLLRQVTLTRAGQTRTEES